ncbi:MAG: DUF721 domain-containing protein [Methylophilaceae bacterium]|nr:DUF721 domain-containing protein [Methylophilaceae bacterium]
MQQLKTLFSSNESSDNRLIELNRHAEAINLAQKLWLTAAPQQISQFSRAISLKNHQLYVVADNGAIATKIKLLRSTLLTKLHNLTLSDPFSRGCKVTAIDVKVQAKSNLNKPPKLQRRLSDSASHSLTNLVENLTDSPLRKALVKLAKRT